MPSQAGCEMLSLERRARLNRALKETGLDVCQGAVQPHALLTNCNTAQDKGTSEPTETCAGVRSELRSLQHLGPKELHRPHPGHLQATPTWPCGLKSRQRRKQPGHRSLKKPAQPPKVPPGLRASKTCWDSSHSSKSASGDNCCFPD